jgi:hypothetical protein
VGRKCGKFVVQPLGCLRGLIAGRSSLKRLSDFDDFKKLGFRECPMSDDRKLGNDFGHPKIASNSRKTPKSDSLFSLLRRRNCSDPA